MNGTRSRPSAREMPKARWRLFTTSTGDISIARLHIGLGTYYLIYPLVGVFSQALLRRGSQVAANSDGPAAWPLLVALIILLVGGLALILETRTERLPDPALWPMPTGPTTDKPTFYWCDIAVLQLGLGVALVPALASAYPSAVAAWRIVAITSVSELVYLAFLGARLAQKEELSEVLRAIAEIRARPADAAIMTRPAPHETAEQKLAKEERLIAMEARAAFLIAQLGLKFPTSAHAR